MTLLLLAGTTGCATYLYSAHVPVAAYNIAQGVGSGTGGEALEILVASADDKMFETGNEAFSASGENIPANVAARNGADDSGQIFADMRTATGYFRDLLRAEQIGNPEDYVLTRVENGNDSEFVLIAAVYRPRQLIEVQDERFPGTRNVITDRTPAFYAPYRTDTDGRPLDQVVAWSLVSVNCLNGSEQQAMVLRDTAEVIQATVPQENFWAARQQWEAGDVGVLMLAGNMLSCPAPASAQG